MSTCSFCGKTQREVAKLVASDKGVAICDECLVVAFAQMAGSGIKFLTSEGVKALTGKVRQGTPSQ